MEQTLGNITGKPTDYKICKECKKLNWYENEECIDCGKKDFIEDEQEVLKWSNEEYQFYMKDEGYNEADADDILVEI